MSELYEVAFGNDEATYYCMAMSESDAIAKFINNKYKILTEAEEPGWEDHVWARNINQYMIT